MHFSFVDLSAEFGKETMQVLVISQLHYIVIELEIHRHMTEH